MRTTIYLPDHIYHAARQGGLNISQLTRHAIKHQLDTIERERNLADSIRRGLGGYGQPTAADTGEA